MLVHSPNKRPFTTRYYGWNANRPRGMRPKAEAEPVEAAAPPAMVPAPQLPPTEAASRWAALQQIFEAGAVAVLRPRLYRVMAYHAT